MTEATRDEVLKTIETLATKARKLEEELTISNTQRDCTKRELKELREVSEKRISELSEALKKSQEELEKVKKEETWYNMYLAGDERIKELEALVKEAWEANDLHRTGITGSLHKEEWLKSKGIN
jgi:hypothetical protein